MVRKLSLNSPAILVRRKGRASRRSAARLANLENPGAIDALRRALPLLVRADPPVAVLRIVLQQTPVW